jgi:hypothetical protein
MNVKDIVDDYKKIGEALLVYNECFWSWEYDQRFRYALIFVNVKTHKLRFLIIEEYTKTGFTPGTIKDIIVEKEVGTLQQPDIKLILSIMKDKSFDRTRAARPFTELWYKGMTNVTTDLESYLKQVAQSLNFTSLKNTSGLNTEKVAMNYDFNAEVSSLEDYIVGSFEKINAGLKNYKIDNSQLLPIVKKIREDFDNFRRMLDQITMNLN